MFDPDGLTTSTKNLNESLGLTKSTCLVMYLEYADPSYAASSAIKLRPFVIVNDVSTAAVVTLTPLWNFDE